MVNSGTQGTGYNGLTFPSASTSDILVLKLISVLVFILFSSQNFYFVLVFWINDNSSFYIVFCMILFLFYLVFIVGEILVQFLGSTP